MPEDERPEQKKVDEAWKERARQDKEQAGPAEGSEEPQAAEEAGQQAEPEESLREKLETPEAKFAILVSSVATQVLVSLGEVENPVTEKKEVDLDSAKFSIDLLQMLADKTRGNLSEPEKRYLERVLYDLRMRFVDASKGG